MTPPTDRQPRVASAGARAVARLRRGPATSDELTRLIYGDAPPRVIQALIGALRERGYVISHDWEGYSLVSEPETNDAGRATRSPAQAIYALLTTRGNLSKYCDCGLRATSVALFYQLTADNRTRFINTLPACDSCGAAFTDAEQIITMEEAYAMAQMPVPPPAQPRPARGGPTSPADCPVDGDGGPTGGDRQRGATHGLPRRAGGSHAPAR